MQSILFLAWSLVFLPLSHADETTELDDVSKFCLKHSGQVLFTLDLSDNKPNFKLNGTCDTSLLIKTATLELCPPKSGTDESDIRLLDIDFRLEDSDWKIDQFAFTNNILITNDSISGPFQNGAEPALLTPGDNPRNYNPHWMIRGTEKSLYKAPEAGSGAETTIFCDTKSESNAKLRACTNQTDVLNGCRFSETFEWDMQARLNFTIEYMSRTPTFKLYSELEEKDENGKGMGSYSNLTVKFYGDGDKDSGLEYKNDLDGMMMINNLTDGSWYFTGNHTFSSTASSTLSGAGMVGVLSVLATVCAVMLG